MPTSRACASAASCVRGHRPWRRLADAVPIVHRSPIVGKGRVHRRLRNPGAAGDGRDYAPFMGWPLRRALAILLLVAAPVAAAGDRAQAVREAFKPLKLPAAGEREGRHGGAAGRDRHRGEAVPRPRRAVRRAARSGVRHAGRGGRGDEGHADRRGGRRAGRRVEGRGRRGRGPPGARGRRRGAVRRGLQP